MKLALRERWRQATSPEVRKNSFFLAGSTFFAGFLRVPFFMTANHLIINFASKREGIRKEDTKVWSEIRGKDANIQNVLEEHGMLDNITLDNDEKRKLEYYDWEDTCTFLTEKGVSESKLTELREKWWEELPEETKEKIQYEVESGKKGGLNIWLNMLAASLQAFVVPVTLLVGGFVKEFVTADVEIDDRATTKGEQALNFLKAGSTAALNRYMIGQGVSAIDDNLQRSTTPEAYVSSASYLQKTMDKRFDTVSTLKTFAFIEHMLDEAMVRARADNKTRAEMGDHVLISKDLENMADELNVLSRYKGVAASNNASQGVQTGELIHQRGGGIAAMSAEELGLYARDMLTVVAKYMDLSNTAAIVDAEDRAASAMPDIPAQPLQVMPSQSVSQHEPQTAQSQSQSVEQGSKDPTVNLTEAEASRHNPKSIA